MTGKKREVIRFKVGIIGKEFLFGHPWREARIHASTLIRDPAESFPVFRPKTLSEVIRVFQSMSHVHSSGDSDDCIRKIPGIPITQNS